VTRVFKIVVGEPRRTRALNVRETLLNTNVEYPFNGHVLREGLTKMREPGAKLKVVTMNHDDSIKYSTVQYRLVMAFKNNSSSNDEEADHFPAVTATRMQQKRAQVLLELSAIMLNQVVSLDQVLQDIIAITHEGNSNDNN
jgi:hypothetical protein